MGPAGALLALHVCMRAGAQLAKQVCNLLHISGLYDLYFRTCTLPEAPVCRVSVATAATLRPRLSLRAAAPRSKSHTKPPLRGLSAIPSHSRMGGATHCESEVRLHPGSLGAIPMTNMVPLVS